MTSTIAKHAPVNCIQNDVELDADRKISLHIKCDDLLHVTFVYENWTFKTMDCIVLSFLLFYLLLVFTSETRNCKLKQNRSVPGFILTRSKELETKAFVCVALSFTFFLLLF